MKNSTAKMLAGAALISLFVMAGCAGKDEMAMDEMKNETMKAEMTTDSGIKKMDSKMDDISHEKMDTMKTEMDESMENDMKKME